MIFLYHSNKNFKYKTYQNKEKHNSQIKSFMQNLVLTILFFYPLQHENTKKI